MKTVNYPLEELLQEAHSKDKNILVNSFKAILETNKDHMRKADYICYAITSIDSRIDAIDEQLEHLINLKKRLSQAKDISLEAGAEAFEFYGITKIEGSAFESITTTKPIESNKQKLVIIEEEPLIEQGFFKYKKVLDKQRVLDEYLDGTYKKFIEQHTKLENVFQSMPSRLQVNKRDQNCTYSSGVAS